MASASSDSAQLDRDDLLIDLAKQRVLREGDFGQASRVVAQAATAIMSVPRAGIWVFDGSHSSITSNVLYDTRERLFLDRVTLPRDRYPAYFNALEQERVIAAADVTTDPRTGELRDEYWKPNGVSASLDAPIRVGDVTIGVVCLERRGKPGPWSQDDVHRASTIADLVAISWEVSERRKAEIELATTALLQRTVTQISARFVSLTPEETDDIVSAIIAMAGSLRIATLAEGVEEEVQRDFLVERGCREMQGFLFARPLPFDSLLGYIDNGLRPS